MNYDLLVIGAGPGGYEAAIRGAQLGLCVALAEKDDVGGTCLNRGCIPTKALLHETGELADMMQRKNEVVHTLRDGVEQLLEKNNIKVLRGEATIVEPYTVSINGETITAEHILCATGSVPQRPPIPGLELRGVITSDELLLSDDVPETMVIIGGGVIGVEFAGVFEKLGTKVIIIEALDRILPQMDREISQNLSMILKRKGIEIHSSARVEAILSNESGLEVVYEEKQKTKNVFCDKVLVATGRKPNTARLFSREMTPEMEKGFLVVDDSFRTSIENVYAIGDVIGGMMLAHQASAQGIACVELICQFDPNQDLSVIPACVYTTPEIATVGLTADMAAEQGIAVKVGKYLMGGNGRTVIERGARGFIKVVVREKDNVIIGAQMMCERATDMIGEMTSAIVNDMTYHQLARGIRPHPTFNEGLLEALHAIDGCAIHIMPRR